MADSIENKDKDELAEEDTELQDISGESDTDEEPDDKDTDSSDQKGSAKKDQKGLIGSLFRHKLILISVTVLALIITGLWFKFGPELMKSLGMDRQDLTI